MTLILPNATMEAVPGEHCDVCVTVADHAVAIVFPFRPVTLTICDECLAHALETATGYKFVAALHAWTSASRISAAIRASRKAQKET